jgi:hypothetical protein
MSFWNSKIVKKTKKKHKCQYCGRIIQIGESCSNEVGTYEGDFNNYYVCNRCCNAIDELHIEFDGELGDFYECIYDYTDLCRCPACGSRKNREREWSDDSMSCTFECDNCDEIWTKDFSFKKEEKIEQR